jgi:hypothetical protein
VSECKDFFAFFSLVDNHVAGVPSSKRVLRQFIQIALICLQHLGIFALLNLILIGV